MKLHFQKNDLVSAIQIVARAVASKTTMSIMECILLDATEGKITLTGNKSEFGIETICPGEIVEPGKVALEAKLFQEIVKRLPQTENRNLSIETEDNGNCTIRCEKSVFKIMGRNADEFPSLPTVEKQEAISVSQFTLRNMINQTMQAVKITKKWQESILKSRIIFSPLPHWTDIVFPSEEVV